MFPALRDIKRKARRDLHEAMRIPVVYLRTRTSKPIIIHVRLHNNFEQVGSLAGGRVFPAQMENLNPQVIFDLNEIPEPEDGATLSFDRGEAYVVDHTLQPDGSYMHAYVTRLLADRTVGLPILDDDGRKIVYPGEA